MTLDVARAAATSGAPRVPPLPALVGQRVLVVDDVAQVACSTAKLLHLFGGVAAASHSGTDALARLEAAPVDLLILDLGLPDVGGREVLARARALHPTLPVIVISGLPADEDEPPLGRGVSFLAKPFALAELLGAVEDALSPVTPGG